MATAERDTILSGQIQQAIDLYEPAPIGRPTMAQFIANYLTNWLQAPLVSGGDGPQPLIPSQFPALPPGYSYASTSSFVPTGLPEGKRALRKNLRRVRD